MNANPFVSGHVPDDMRVQLLILLYLDILDAVGIKNVLINVEHTDQHSAMLQASFTAFEGCWRG